MPCFLPARSFGFAQRIRTMRGIEEALVPLGSVLKIRFSYTTADSSRRKRRLSLKEGPCAVATSFLTATGNASHLSFLRRDTAPVAVGPWKTITASSTASFGACTPAPLGETSRILTALGKPSTAASDAGAATARGR